MTVPRRPILPALILAALLAAPAMAQQDAAQGDGHDHDAPAAPAGAAAVQETGTPSEAHDHGAPSAPAGSEAPVATGQRTPAPRDAYVYIGWPNDGQVIRSTRFKVWFGTRNFGVAPAGTSKPNTGHHHLLIDTDLPPMDQEIPNDKHHLHFGLGQTETTIELPPGTHTLQLLMGDARHIPHDPPVMSKRITIHVRAEGGSVASAN